MGSSVLAAVVRKKPGCHLYCQRQMEHLLTRGLSHNTPALSPKHSKPIFGSQFKYFSLFFCVISLENGFSLYLFCFCIFWIYPTVLRRFNSSVEKHLRDTKYDLERQFRVVKLFRSQAVVTLLGADGNDLPTQCTYVFCVDLRTNSDYFTVQH
jgi:hypothetical protein